VTQEQTFSRRKFIGAAAAGAAGWTALGSWAPKAFGGPNGHGERLVPPGKLGIQQWAVRDAITRLDASVMGHLGGPNFPEDPSDLGPLVPLPGGFRAVFEYLTSVGYRGFEFFSFSQGSNGAITHAEIRQALDDAGLYASGTHTGGLATMVDPAMRQEQIDIARILGYTIIGTAGDPVTGAGANLLANWQIAAQNYNTVGAALAAEGMRYYLHPEQNNFNFFNDPAHPELSRVHRIDWFTDNTDPRLVFFEPDIFHAYSGRARFPDPVDGSLWDILGWLTANSRRILAWHVKDGVRVVPQPAPPQNPFTQTIARTPTFTDVVYVGEGSIGQGYPVDPDPVVVGFERLFDEVMAGRKGSRFYLAESDNSPGPPSDPGRSLRWARISAEYLLGLRAGSTAQTQGSMD
jgi:sugar phosphate isomerase/epimerase